METFYAILITGFLATIGWIFTARRTWALSRKQHTINIILQANFDDGFLADRDTVAPLIREGNVTVAMVRTRQLEVKLRRVLNHHEFVAAAVRAGDIEEGVLKDSEESLYIELFEACGDYIREQRAMNDRPTLYEHLEWLHARWSLDPPNPIQRFWERIAERPIHPNTARLKAIQRGFGPG
jgi:hypothetical protein